MWLLCLFAFLFAAHVTGQQNLTAGACVSDFNNARFTLNKTFSDLFWSRLDYNAEGPTQLVPDNRAGQGWAEVVSFASSARDVWPRGPDGYHRIYYCYVSPWVRQQLRYRFEMGWHLWRQRLGDPSPQAGHRLTMTETMTQDGQPIYCGICAPGPNAPSMGPNPSLPRDVLAIYADTREEQQGGAFATSGYMVSSWSNKAMRHNIHIGYTLAIDNRLPDQHWNMVIAHELGHVFGLEHEHQRPDRDRWVKFQCQNLNGYNDYKQRVESNPEARQRGITMRVFCDDWLAARQLHMSDFPSNQYSTRPLYDIWDDNGRLRPNPESSAMVIQHDAEFDYDSIMLYSSDVGGIPGSNTDVSRGVLVKWKEQPNWDYLTTPVNFQTAEIIHANYVPSPKDIEILKKLYRW